MKGQGGQGCQEEESTTEAPSGRAAAEEGREGRQQTPPAIRATRRPRAAVRGAWTSACLRSTARRLRRAAPPASPARSARRARPQRLRSAAAGLFPGSGARGSEARAERWRAERPSPAHRAEWPPACRTLRRLRPSTRLVAIPCPSTDRMRAFRSAFRRACNRTPRHPCACRPFAHAPAPATCRRPCQ